MNGRTALGAGFVLLADLAGALFLDRAQRLVPVYAATRDLPAGTPLRSGDLTVVRVRLPDSSLRHYLRPGPDPAVAGRVLTAPVRRETLVPAELALASQQADMVELPVQADPGDMAQGLRPGDRVQVLAAYTDGARRGRAVVLLPTAEVVRVLEDPAGLTGTGQERGVQLRMPSDRAPSWPPPSPPPGSSWSRRPAPQPARPRSHRRPRAIPRPRRPTPPSPTARDPAPPSPATTIGQLSLRHLPQRVPGRGQGGDQVKLQLVTAGGGAAWEPVLVQANCEYHLTLPIYW